MAQKTAMTTTSTTPTFLGDLDTNVNSYTIADLFVILNLSTKPSTSEVKKKAGDLIAQFEKDGNDTMAAFFSEMQDRVLGYLDNPEKDSSAIQTNQWFTNQYLKQADTVQNNKITTRKQKVGLYDDNHLTMNREQLGVDNNYTVPVAQDVLNPTLENTFSRFINIDSQFRQASNGAESSATDFTLDLSDPLKNVLSLRLYSVQIPVAWYNFDTYYSNTCYWIRFSSGYTVAMGIPPGNYSTVPSAGNNLVYALNTDPNVGFGQSGFQGTGVANPPVSFNAATGKLTFSFVNVSYKDATTGQTYAIDATTELIFYDVEGKLNCGTYCNASYSINQTMGWLLGFRSPSIFIDIANGNTAEALVDLYGPKYLILCIDDYNQNHINNGLITISEASKYVKLPDYYSPDLPIACTSVAAELQQQQASIRAIQGSNSNAWLDKIDASFKPLPTVLPTAPRTLTQTQIYAINEIRKNNERNTSYRSKAPTNSDTFALIPIKHSASNTTGEIYVEFGGSLQDNKRIYFGPVNIDRLRIKLYNDKGNLLNMNGADWSITMISDLLYQY